MLKVYSTKRWGSKYIDNRNWHIYTRQLIRRGELYISLDFIDTWDKELIKMNRGKVGGKFLYPDKFVRWAALVYQVMDMPYRTLQGFIQKLSQYIPGLKPAYYTTLYRRIRDAKIDLIDTIPLMTGEYVIAVDTSGIKISKRGDWLHYKWKVNKEQRGWIKIHLAVDTRRKELVGIEVTDEKIGDDSKFKDLVNQSRKNMGDAKVKKVLADGAYDRRKIFNYLRKNRIKAGINMRKDARSDSKKSPYRTACVGRREQIGHDAWKREVGYTKRWIIECMFSSVKRMFGESVKAKTNSGSLREAYRKFVFYNALNNYGRGKISGI